jgi:hypothetical protein
MNHRDNPRSMQFLNRPESLCASHGMPSAHKQRLQHYDRENDPKERRKIE